MEQTIKVVTLLSKETKTNKQAFLTQQKKTWKRFNEREREKETLTKERIPQLGSIIRELKLDRVEVYFQIRLSRNKQ